MGERPRYVNCRNFINSKLEEKIGDRLKFVNDKTIAVINNIDLYAKLHGSFDDISIQKNGEDNIVFFSIVPSTNFYKTRELWGFQLKENKKEFLDKYKSKFNLFSSNIKDGAFIDNIKNYIDNIE